MGSYEERVSALLVSDRALDAGCGAVGLDLGSAGAKRYRRAIEAAAPIIIAEFMQGLSEGLAEKAREMLDE